MHAYARPVPRYIAPRSNAPAYNRAIRDRKVCCPLCDGFAPGATPMLMRPVEAIAAQISVASHVSHDKFDILIDRLDLVPKLSSYEKGAEIYWEESSMDYVYQVVSGAVRNYTLLSDGRCQITAFYLPGDISVLTAAQAAKRPLTQSP